jgi:hypothetical protein
VAPRAMLGRTGVQRAPFELSRAKAWIMGLVLSLVSTLALVYAASLRPGVPSSALTSVSSVLLSIGIIAIGYEFFVRGTYAQELLDLVGTTRALAESGISRLCSERDVDWPEFLAAGHHYRLLLLDPIGWIERQWPHVLAAGRAHPISAEVFVVDPESSALGLLADRLGQPPDGLHASIGRAVDTASQSWALAQSSAPRLTKRCSLEVRCIDRVPSYAIITVDDRCVVLLRATATHEPLKGIVAIRFDGHGSFAFDWFRGQLDDLAQSSRLYVKGGRA